MEQKLVRVLFDIEMAKRIQNGEIEGRIVTRNGYNVRIVCFDAKTNYYPIVAMMADENGEEVVIVRAIDGKTVPSDTDTDQGNLILEIPEYLTFKDGDIIAYDNCCTISLIRGDFYKNDNGDTCSTAYATLIDCITIHPIVMDGARFATEAEKQKLIDALKASKDPKAKEYLKRFFGIEEKKEYEFKPFDKVLVRNDCEVGEWGIELFERYIEGEEPYICMGDRYNYCIPYNEQTAHLLGTTENWEG